MRRPRLRVASVTPYRSATAAAIRRTTTSGSRILGWNSVGLLATSLESVLKDVATAAVASIEGDGIARQELAHQCREPGRAAAQQQVGVIGQETPGVNGGARAPHAVGHARHEVLPIGGCQEELSALDPAHHHVVQGPGGIQTRTSRHRANEYSALHAMSLTILHHLEMFPSHISPAHASREINDTSSPVAANPAPTRAESLCRMGARRPTPDISARLSVQGGSRFLTLKADTLRSRGIKNNVVE